MIVTINLLKKCLHISNNSVQIIDSFIYDKQHLQGKISENVSNAIIKLYKKKKKLEMKIVSYSIKSAKSLDKTNKKSYIYFRAFIIQIVNSWLDIQGRGFILTFCIWNVNTNKAI